MVVVKIGKYDDISYRLISHCDEIFPFRAFDTSRDWDKIDDFVSKIPLDGERLMTSDEVLGFYE